MKAAVYAVEIKGCWSLRLTLDLKTDLNWWQGDRQADAADGRLKNLNIVILSSCLPLGWASNLRDNFVHRDEMHRWDTKAWDNYMGHALKEELRVEEEAKRRLTGAKPGSGMNQRTSWIGPAEFYRHESGGERTMDAGESVGVADGRVFDIEREAYTLAELIIGRSLLESELTAMLSERCPKLLSHWRSAVQQAYLNGWIQIEAAVVTETKPAFRLRPKVVQPRGRSGGLAAVHTTAASLCRGRWAPRGVFRRRALPRCRHCGSAATARTACGSCGLSGCAYCEACLALGRSRSCALLLRSAALPAVRGTAGFDPAAAVRGWGLSAAQAEAACATLAFLAEPCRRSADRGPERFLLWAVTGAGKTEMTFPLLRYVLDRGGKVLVASPRRDVVLELAPRMAAAFPGTTSAVLYGGSPQRWDEAQLVLSTTHQLLRFHQAFDLVIIDELDAYPFHNNPMLAYAAESACRVGGRFIFLSATPPAAMQREMREGSLPHAKVPSRYHGHPLPVPRRMEMREMEVCLRRGFLPAPFIHHLEESFRRGAQIFVFVSRIRHIEPLAGQLRLRFPELPIQGTSSQDKGRADKVLAFRSGEVRLLVTTTILERGVTVPRSDVFILDADCSLFDEASLVQMAGRAGRSAADPCGAVWFVSPKWTKSQRAAIRQIQRMNTIARKKGYLHEVQEVQ